MSDVGVSALSGQSGVRWGLGREGHRSIRAGLMAVAHDINRMLSWSGIQALEGRTSL